MSIYDNEPFRHFREKLREQGITLGRNWQQKISDAIAVEHYTIRGAGPNNPLTAVVVHYEGGGFEWHPASTSVGIEETVQSLVDRMGEPA